MPISAIPPNDRQERFVASAGQTVFPFDFPVYDAAHLVVVRTRDGAHTTLLPGADYNVSGAGQQAGGTVTLASGALAGDVIAIGSNQPYARSTSFAEGGELRAENLNAEFNRVAIALQQLDTARAQAVRPPGSEPVLQPLPPMASRAGQDLGFDANGQPIAVPRAYVTQTGPAPSGVTNWVHIDSFLAVGRIEGVTDDTAAFQAAATQLGPTGGIVWLGPRLYRLAGQVTQAAPILWQGAGLQEGPQALSPNRPPRGTWIWHDSAAVPSFLLADQACQGSAFRDLAFWETHPAPAAGWAPTVRPPCVRVQNASESLRFEGVHFHNVYWGIDAANCGRVELYRVTGQPFWALIRIDRAYDVARWQQVHAWPYWSAHAGVLAWQQANGAVFRIGRADGIFADATFALGYHQMFLFYAPTGDGGTTTKFYFGDVYSDFVGRMIQVDQDGFFGQGNSLTHHGEDWAQIGTGNGLADGHAILFNGSNGHLQVGNLFSSYTDGAAIRLRKGQNRVDVQAARFVWWGSSDPSGPAVLLDAPDVGFTNNLVAFGGAPWLGPRFSGQRLLTTGNAAVATRPLLVNLPTGWTDPDISGNDLRGNAALTAGTPSLSAIGTDASIGIDVVAKGTGPVTLHGGGGWRLSAQHDRIDTAVPVRVRVYTLATLPSAAAFDQYLAGVADRQNRLAVAHSGIWRWMDGTAAS